MSDPFDRYNAARKYLVELKAELAALGIDQRDFPYRSDSADGIARNAAFDADERRIRDLSGFVVSDVYIADRSRELWAADSRNPQSGRPQPTKYALEKIPEIESAYRVMRRSSNRVSKESVATRVGIDRETITDWVKSGWMTWPPSENPQV